MQHQKRPGADICDLIAPTDLTRDRETVELEMHALMRRYERAMYEGNANAELYLELVKKYLLELAELNERDKAELLIENLVCRLFSGQEHAAIVES